MPDDDKIEYPNRLRQCELSMQLYVAQIPAHASYTLGAFLAGIAIIVSIGLGKVSSLDIIVFEVPSVGVLSFLIVLSGGAFGLSFYSFCRGIYYNQLWNIAYAYLTLRDDYGWILAAPSKYGISQIMLVHILWFLENNEFSWWRRFRLKIALFRRPRPGRGSDSITEWVTEKLDDSSLK